MNNESKNQHNKNIVLFSAKVNIESPPEMIENNTKTMDLTDDEREWKEFILKQYFNGKRPPKILDEKQIIIQQRPLFNDILRTLIILIIFTIILMIFMLIGLFLYKKISLFHRKKYSIHQKQKHEPFPGDDAYDNLKTSGPVSTTDSGTATDV